MSDPTGAQAPMRPQDATLVQIGELKGLMQASLHAQQRQLEINDQHDREHDSFRATDADHGTRIAVLEDNKQAARAAATDRIQKWMNILSLPTTLIALGVCIAWLSTIVPH